QLSQNNILPNLQYLDLPQFVYIDAQQVDDKLPQFEPRPHLKSARFHYLSNMHSVKCFLLLLAAAPALEEVSFCLQFRDMFVYILLLCMLKMNTATNKLPSLRVRTSKLTINYTSVQLQALNSIIDLLCYIEACEDDWIHIQIRFEKQN